MPEITELYTYDGSYYEIPKDYDTIALWYNKTMFDAAGLSYPDATWTWDDLYNAAVKLTKKDGSQYGFCMNPSNRSAPFARAADCAAPESGGVMVIQKWMNCATVSPRTARSRSSVSIWRPSLSKRRDMAASSWSSESPDR